MPDEDRIRRRAHAIWEREGRPEGRHQEHWEQARREIEAEEGAAAPDASPRPAAVGGAPPRTERAPEPSPPPDPLASEAARIID